jgi:hypothetical protein
VHQLGCDGQAERQTQAPDAGGAVVVIVIVIVIVVVVVGFCLTLSLSLSLFSGLVVAVVTVIAVAMLPTRCVRVRPSAGGRAAGPQQPVVVPATRVVREARRLRGRLGQGRGLVHVMVSATGRCAIGNPEAVAESSPGQPLSPQRQGSA